MDWLIFGGCRKSSIGYGKAFAQMAVLSLELRCASLELGGLSLELGCASLEFGLLSLELGRASLEFGSASLELRRASLELPDLSLNFAPPAHLLSETGILTEVPLPFIFWHFPAFWII
ncbi:hypothetical protein FH966_01885 [Lentibacillus cibarius]|uniref:Uncharacterized protein n=1 Tax=Lentibacillus cibarius TaxID=2583219 RepID=A0A549YFA3_9BACI|nr:hypothetical protein [Lentibacillus cibarius]TRM10569.1 hypothetical protein FH966_01885 [Lentibacillus cibarius]